MLVTKTPACACARCKNLCQKNPGWPTPEEATKLMDLGYAPRMMLDWYNDSPDDIEIICPASRGYEGERADDPSFMDLMCGWSKGPCVMQDAEGLCELHTSGAKPFQCRTALGCSEEKDDAGSNEEIKKFWDTDEGRAVVTRWKKEVGYGRSDD